MTACDVLHWLTSRTALLWRSSRHDAAPRTPDATAAVASSDGDARGRAIGGPQ